MRTLPTTLHSVATTTSAALLGAVFTASWTPPAHANPGAPGLAPSQAVCANPELSDTAHRLSNLCPSGLCQLREIQNASASLERDSLFTLVGLPEARVTNVFFHYARSQLHPAEVPDYPRAVAGLDALAAEYRRLPTAHLFVLGRASTPGGSADRNFNRSRHRMMSVANYLVGRGVAETDVHLAYFGASAFPLTLADLGDLHISESELGPRELPESARVANLNQSVQAFLWPCAAAAPKSCAAPPVAAPNRRAAHQLAPPAAVAPSRPSAPAAPLGAVVVPCESRLRSTPEEPANKVVLAGGDAGTLLEHYFRALDRAGVRFDAAELQVYYRDASGEDHAESAPKVDFGAWMLGKNQRQLWLDRLAGADAALTAEPDAALGDFVCGFNLPNPAPVRGGWQCSAAGGGRGDLGLLVLAVLAGVVVARRAR